MYDRVAIRKTVESAGDYLDIVVLMSSAKWEQSIVVVSEERVLGRSS